MLPAAAGLALALRHLAGVPYGFEAQRPLLAAFGRYELALALAGPQRALLLAAAPARADWSAWLGALLVAFVVVRVSAGASVPATLPSCPAGRCCSPPGPVARPPAAGRPGPGRGARQCRRRDPGAGAVPAPAHAVLLGVGANLPPPPACSPGWARPACSPCCSPPARGAPARSPASRRCSRPRSAASFRVH
ncbi:MAG: hypothetical protein U1F06_02135 [Steroidobacteraceae bacterium]